ncbi:MAG: radical SAM protein, partial [Thermomicrobium sp.]
MERRWQYAERPLLVYWELTRACQLACRHCRAEAVPWRHPRELSTDEGLQLLDALRGFGQPLPHLVLTGGDPLARPDLFELIAAARERGFAVSITPSGTYALTPDLLRRLREAGITTLALSLDGSTAERHDSLRGVEGSFVWTITAAHTARQLGLPLQVNTLVCAETRDDLPAMLEFVWELGVERWSLFFLVPVGRGRLLSPLTPEEAEAVLVWLAEVVEQVPFAIKTTEAPFYRRVVAQRRARLGRGSSPIS